MYAVVLSNAAEEARLQEQERRLSQANQAEENDDDDDDGDDEQIDDQAISEEGDNRSNLQAQFDVSIESVNAQLQQRRVLSTQNSLR